VIIVVFRSRLRPEAREEYLVWAKRMAATVVTIPGYLSHKAFVAEDGERLTHVAFADEAALKAWALHPDHLDAKRLGRSKFFSEYSFQICSLIRDRKPTFAAIETNTPDPAGDTQP
jgi:heme-degrading monooxygenase HmoA